MSSPAPARWLRRRANGVVVVVGLLLALPLVAVAERVRRGAGRAVAVGAVRVVGRVCGISFEVRGLEHLRPGSDHVFVPNHSSPLDIPAMLVTGVDLRFAAASELFRVPLLAPAMRALDVVPIDRKHPAQARRRLAAVAAEEPGSLCVFAEGGIPAPDEHRPFKAGAFVLAIDAGLPIVPVSIRGSGHVLPRGSRIWARPGHVEVVLHPPIDTTGLTAGDRHALRDRTEAAVRAG